ncbi:MAG: ribonuclease HII [Anaerolineae bacterium]|nr:ribonuclease HII [Anaerolineae bacterium]
MPSTRSSGPLPDLQKEIALLAQGYRFVAGLDEAGRGAWAGPVVAAAVILPLDQPDLLGTLAGLRDSKKLTPHQREQFFELVRATATTASVGVASPAMVDQINVVGATRYAMHQALAGLAITPDYLLIDYLKLPDLDLPQDAFPKADNLSLTVAAASVMAKVIRDRLMIEFHRQYPGYDFDRHKGYGTPAHRTALAAQGPCPLHRLSYKPLQAVRHS